MDDFYSAVDTCTSPSRRGLACTPREIASVATRPGPHPIFCHEAIHLLSVKCNAVDALIAEATGRRRSIDNLSGVLRNSQKSDKG